MGSRLTVSAVGQADDVAICSNNIYMLYNLLLLDLEYCKKLNVELCADKTKLLLFADKTFMVPLIPIMIKQERIDSSEEVEHVCIVRSTSGNIPNIMNRINCSKNASITCGLARGDRQTCKNILAA